jgi:ketosteroid isomerase-like protein
MKMRLLFALAALAIGLAVRAFAQMETIMPDFSGNLAGDVKALEEFNALRMKEDEAFNKNDAAAVAALFTEDAISATPEGMFYGRQAIEKAFVDVFLRWHPTNFMSEGNKLNGIGNDAWAVRDLCSGGR